MVKHPISFAALSVAALVAMTVAPDAAFARHHRHWHKPPVKHMMMKHKPMKHTMMKCHPGKPGCHDGPRIKG